MSFKLVRYAISLSHDTMPWHHVEYMNTYSRSGSYLSAEMATDWVGSLLRMFASM